MEVFHEKINEKEIVFPKDFTYTKTYDGFILDTLSGLEFFKKGIEDTITNLGIFILIVCFIIFMIIAQLDIDIEIFYLVIPTCVGTLLWAIGHFMKKIKTTITVSSRGIEKKKKKNSLFIEKENIANIYASQGLSRDNFFSFFIPAEGEILSNNVKLNEYKVFLECKESIRLPNSNIFMSSFDLFSSHFFYTKKSVVFLVQEFIRVLDLKLDVIFMNGDELVL